MQKTQAWLLVIGIGALAGCGGGSATFGLASQSSPSSPSAAAATTQTDDGGEPVATPTPTPKGKLDEFSFYTISTAVDGEELAITFIPAEGTRAVTNTASKARVELKKLTKEAGQLWQPHPQGEDHILYSKVSDAKEDPTGILIVYNPDNRFSDSDAYQEKFNRLSVGPHSNETREYWRLEPVENGKYRIKSALGLSQGTEDWSEPRALEAVKAADGTFKLRHAPIRKASAQLWTFTRVGQ